MCRGVCVNRKWSEISLGVMWVSTGSGLGLVWGSRRGVGVNRKWSEIILGVIWVVWGSTGSGLGSCGGMDDTSDQQNPYLKISQHMQERLRFRGL